MLPVEAQTEICKGLICQIRLKGLYTIMCILEMFGVDRKFVMLLKICIDSRSYEFHKGTATDDKIAFTREECRNRNHGAYHSN
jgi:hypothetical protein